ncbi:MAG: glycosyl transferase family 1 [Deltaproteobacteria bacterium HGW-Deltaproteobacteria-18]|jgi:glycosyltransferase involved in cell wall biosynthesis|nr:MAG: glycosyl transferase family 1 [Deltaproteobacteria bacterium HGW-Deltaproteobacteria-18]
MRILILHTHYQQPGGEDQSFFSEATLLREQGHAVHNLIFQNQDMNNMSPWRQAWTTLWNQEAYRRTRASIRKLRPRVMHINNTFPLASPGVIHAAKAENVPVIMSLRNYRLLCVNGLFFRNGRPCEACLEHLPWQGALHGCYRNSRPASTVVAGMLTLHRSVGSWHLVDSYIALTEFARQKFLKAGIPSEKVVVKPNFIHNDAGPGDGRGGYALFVGRLSAEKGIALLLAAWGLQGQRVSLKIVGDGPLRAEVERAANNSSNVEYLGAKNPEDVSILMSEAAFLIFPSTCYETFGRVAMEAFAAGTPVLAANIGAIGEITDNGRTGLHFHPGDSYDLAAKVDWLLSHPEELAQMRKEARREYELKYTAERNYEILMGIYNNVMRNA